MVTDDDRLDNLEDRWLAAADSGEILAASDLCADRPDLRDALEARLAILRQFHRLANSGDGRATPIPYTRGNTGSFVQVMVACQSFAQRWSTDSRPAIPDLLAGIDREAKPALLRNLLAIEVDRRRAAGEQPGIEDYLRQFPDYGTVVREVFLDHSSMSVAAGETGVEEPVTPTPSATRLGPYRLLRELGRGGMGVVFEAVHVERGTRVALKTLPAVDGASLYRFKREFRALAEMNHPNLIGLHTLESDGSHWFFTMDLLDGVDFFRYVRPSGALDEARLRAALAQLATGVLALHARHVVHRDLKPSNVLVVDDSRVVLLDFGLVAELDRPGHTQSLERVAGTPRYMAPEQAAGGPVTAAADWYAVGVMMYEALSGKAPFGGPLWQVLQRRQTTDPEPLSTSLNVPADLADLAMRLLERDPASRPDALAVARAIASTVGPGPTAEGGTRKLVGRDAQLAALADPFKTVQRTREPLTVFVSGRSGEGKTALGDQFLAGLRRDGRAAVMSGRCYDRESVPFKALDTLIDALSTYLRGLSESEAALLMPDDVGHLAQVFPVLQRVEVVCKAADTRGTGLDEQQVRQRAFRALRSLLGRISRRAPVVWLVDDLQWGDADSAAALFEVLRPPDAPAVLFVGTYRSDETADSAFLAAWKELQAKHGVKFADRDVRVGPLSEAECAELVIGLIGRDTEPIRRRAAEFARETRGNPFLLIELAGCFDPDTDSFQAMPLHEVLARKLDRLPPEAGPLLDVVAVSGQALAVGEAARTAGIDVSPVATLTRMRNERLIRFIGSEESPLVDTYHDRVRETILAGLAEERRKTLHRALAEVIEADVGGVPAELAAALETGEAASATAIPRVFDLAYHFDAAGIRDKAWKYALLAAEQAKRQSALEVAANNYVIVERNLDMATNALRYRIAIGSGETLMRLGRYPEAEQQLARSVDLTEVAEEKGRAEFLAGLNVMKQGRLGECFELEERALTRMGVWVPRSRFGRLVAVGMECLVQCVHSLLPFGFHRKPATARSDLTIETLAHLGGYYTFTSSIKLLWAITGCVNRAERVTRSAQLAVSYGFHSCMMTMIGWSSRGSKYGARAVAIAREFNDLQALGTSYSFNGIGLYFAARYEASLAGLTDAIAAFERAGDPWAINLDHFHRGCCHFALGDLGEVAAEARWVFAASARQGDSRTMCSSWLWARVTEGNLPFESLKACLPCRPDDVMSTIHGVMAEGLWHRFHGRTGESLAAFEKARAMAGEHFCWNGHTILALPMLAGALRLHAHALANQDRPAAARLRRRSKRVAKWATRITRFFPAAYPLALRERSLILADLGKTRKALKLADKSCRKAEAQKAKYEHARSLLVRGRLAKQLGRPEADEQIRTAEAAIEEMERPVHQPAAGR